MTAPALEPRPTLKQRIAPRTREEADRRRFGLWVLVALIVLLPPWWIWGADLAAAALRPLAEMTLGLAGLKGGITAGAEGWAISTGLPLADGSGTLRYVVDAPLLRRMLLGVPLFAAFMIAPPRSASPVRAVLIGLVVFAVLFLASLTAFVWGEIAPMLNPDLAGVDGVSQRLAGLPLNPVLAQIAVIGRYLAMSVAGLLVAVVLWAVLNARGRAALLGALEDKG